MDSNFAREYYESASADHWWFQGRKTLLKGLVHRFGQPRGNFLDLGAGSESLLPSTARVTKLDLVKPVGVSGQFVQASAELLPFRRGSFDGVGVFDVLEHLDDPTACLTEVRRVIRDDATVYVTVPAHQWLWSRHDEVVGHMKRYSAEDLTAELVDAGFFPIVVKPFYGFLLGPAFIRKLVATDSPMRMPGKRINRILTGLAITSARRMLEHRSRYGLSLVAVATPVSMARKEDPSDLGRTGQVFR